MAGAQHAAVEEDVRGRRERAALAQELGEVAGDGGVGGVGEADFLQAGAAAALRHVRARDRGEEAVEQDAVEVGAAERALDGAADQAGAAAENGDGVLLLLRSGLEQLLLGDAALLPERVELQGVELGALLASCWLTVWASARSMLSPPSRMCSPTATRSRRELAVLFGDGDQGEVGGAAADVDDQDQVADLDLLAPIGMAFDPGVEGGLRLFEQDDVAGSRLCSAACSVSSRATASKDAGTVTRTCCWSKGASG